MRLAGTPAAPGIAIAPAWRFSTVHTEGGARGDATPRAGGTVEGPEAGGPAGPRGGRVAAARLDLAGAAKAAAEQLMGLGDRVRALGRAEEAEIFDAQALMAEDPTLLDAAGELEASGRDPADAVRAAAAVIATGFEALDDELLAARASDVRDVAERIARILNGETIAPPERPSIAVADDLPPSITAEIPAGLLIGIALERGSRTAHAAILARSLGIPAVVGIAGLLPALEAAGDVEIALDGSAGEVFIDPTADERSLLDARTAEAGGRTARAVSLRGRPPALADGEPVMLAANIGSPDEARGAIEREAAGVGLFRTEFLFMERLHPPTEAEQVAAYRRVLTEFGPDRPVVVRLADIGGDKSIPYLGLPHEDNPFLGVRAIRLAYASHDLLRTQLRAISRAGALAGVRPHCMAPMVATLADVDLLLELRDDAQASLAAEGVDHAPEIVTGIMVEIPSAALMAAELAPKVDFFSIGTNDLTQYTLAADRGNAALDGLQDALHPAVLRLIRSVVTGADAAGIPVAVCGELAGDPAGALVLTGLGVDELSMSPGSIDAVRLALSEVTRPELDELASRAVGSASAGQVRDLVAPLLARTS